MHALSRRRERTMTDTNILHQSYYGTQSVARNILQASARPYAMQIRALRGANTLAYKGIASVVVIGCHDQEGCSVTPHDVFFVQLLTSNSVPHRQMGKCYVDTKFEYDALTLAMTSCYTNIRICHKFLLQICSITIPKRSWDSIHLLPYNCKVESLSLTSKRCRNR